MFRQSSWVTCREDLSLQPDLMAALRKRDRPVADKRYSETKPENFAEAKEDTSFQNETHPVLCFNKMN